MLQMPGVDKHFLITFSGSEGGGISDALTAVVSDTEGHGQEIESRAAVRARQQGEFLAPSTSNIHLYAVNMVL